MRLNQNAPTKSNNHGVLTDAVVVQCRRARCPYAESATACPPHVIFTALYICSTI
jgi:hypothetical protein